VLGNPAFAIVRWAWGIFMSRFSRLSGRAFLAGALAFSAGLTTASARETVRFDGGYSAGTIVVKTGERRLYYVLGDGRALRYVVGVGRPGRAWSGSTFIRAKELNPGYIPPPEVKHDNPAIPNFIPGGSPHNPLGVAALHLGRIGYAIHGTNKPGLIGGFVSYGCIRMYNHEVADLYNRVGFGTSVVVLR
jgi:lipoprotein-anchoring transpeptidase ErfK/SrfK